MILINKTNGRTVGYKILNAKSFFQRLTGLMTRKFNAELDGIYFEKCNAVHSFFMSYEFDLIFVDKRMTVLKLYRNVKPYRIYKVKNPAATAIECPVMTIFNAGLKVGDQLEMESKEL